MAPSRALLVRRIICATATPRLRPTSLLLTTSAAPVRTIRRISGLESSPVQQPQICRPCTRAYSQSASTTPQPPDFLNEAELHVFNKIRSELEPVKLEVCTAFPAFLSADIASMRRHGRIALMTPVAPPITALFDMRVISALQRLSGSAIKSRPSDGGRLTRLAAYFGMPNPKRSFLSSRDHTLLTRLQRFKTSAEVAGQCMRLKLCRPSSRV